jgi:YVTN family beta-propeller protein
MTMKLVTLIVQAVLVVGSAILVNACQMPLNASNTSDSGSLPIAYVDLPAHPFGVVATPNGRWLFVSVLGDEPTESAIAVLHRSANTVSLIRTIKDDDPLGMTLTHDGKWLIVADNTKVEFLDVGRATSRDGNTLIGEIVESGHFPYSSPNDRKPIAVYPSVTKDDHFLFVSEENIRNTMVIDLSKPRSSNFAADAVVGHIPTAFAPIAVTFSPDQHYLYMTSQIALASYGWPKACKPEGQDPATAQAANPEGAIIVADVGRAKTDPANSVIAKVPAGCSPVRLALSPSGDRAYVTARNSNALLVFDTGKLLSDPEHARIATIPVGTAPVGVAVTDAGKHIVVTNSNRFSGGTNDHESLSVVDSSHVADGGKAVLGTIPAGGDPRELGLTDNGRTLLVTNFNSKTLEIVDLDRVALTPAK